MKKVLLYVLSLLIVLSISGLCASADDSYDPYGNNDSRKWHLDTIGVSQAWDYGFTGSDDIVVAVLDTGINPHPDLTDNVDFLRGMSVSHGVVGNTSNISFVSDITGHGSHIAGIIGANLDGIGTNGICKNVSIVPVKIYTDDEHLNADYLAESIEYAIDIEADIINYSQRFFSGAYNTLLTYNGLFVSSAGNDHVSLPSVMTDNSLVPHPDNVMLVGASTSTNSKCVFSNFGANAVEIFAPGESIYSTVPTSSYDEMSGTSMAAPMVAAGAALIMANATHLSPEDVVDLFVDSAEYSSALNNLCIADGILSINNAIYDLYTQMRDLPYQKGDVDGDQLVTYADYQLCRMYCLGSISLDTDELNAADVNCDNVVNARDYLLIDRYCNKTFYFPPY